MYLLKVKDNTGVTRIVLSQADIPADPADAYVELRSGKCVRAAVPVDYNVPSVSCCKQVERTATGARIALRYPDGRKYTSEINGSTGKVIAFWEEAQ